MKKSFISVLIIALFLTNCSKKQEASPVDDCKTYYQSATFDNQTLSQYYSDLSGGGMNTEECDNMDTNKTNFRVRLQAYLDSSSLVKEIGKLPKKFTVNPYAGNGQKTASNLSLSFTLNTSNNLTYNTISSTDTTQFYNQITTCTPLGVDGNTKDWDLTGIYRVKCANVNNSNDTKIVTGTYKVNITTSRR